MSAQRRSSALLDERPSGSAEAQLRAHVSALEAQLADISRCLEDAENRAAELLAVRAELAEAQRLLAVIRATRSWRFTAPVRVVGARVRRLLGH